MENINMCATANISTKTQDQKQSGCCCRTSSYAAKSIETETRKTAATVNEMARNRSSPCCSGH